MKERSPMYSFKDIKIPSYEELVNKPDMKVVDIRSERDERPFKEQRDELRNSNFIDNLYSEPITNRDTGEKIFFTPATLTHSFSNNSRYKISTIKNIRALIENAVFTHGEAATHGADNTTGVYTLFSAVRTDAGIQPVRIKVKEYILDGKQIPKNINDYFARNGVINPYSSVYDSKVLVVEEINKEDVSSLALSGTGTNPVLGEYPSTSSTISIAQLLSLVNSEYKKYLPNDKMKSNDAAQASYAPAKIDSSSIKDSESNVMNRSSLEPQFIRQSANNTLSNVTSVFDKPAVGAQAYTQIRASSAKNDTVRTGFASGAKQADVETAELAAKAFGRNIIFKSDNYQINGKFADGTIYINPDGSDLVSTTIAHELTHSIEGADGYDEIKAAIKQLVSDRGGDWNALLSEVYDEYSDFYKKQGRELTRAEVESEAVARVVSSMFSDRATLEAFARNNRNVVVRMWNRLKSAVVRFSREIKASFMNDSSSRSESRSSRSESRSSRSESRSSRSESRTAARAQLLLSDMERIRDMFADVLARTKGQDTQSYSKYSFKDIKIPSYEELVNKPDMKVVDIRGERDKRTIKEQRKDFMSSETAKDLYKSPIINIDTGEKIFITPATFTHSFSNNTRFSAKAIEFIKPIVENAVLTHKETATHGADNTTGVYTLFSAVRTDAGIQPVRIKVKEYILDGKQIPKNINDYFARNGVMTPYSSVYDSKVLVLEEIKESASGLVTAAQSTSGLSASDPSTLPLSATNYSSLQMKNVSSSALSGTGTNPVLGEYPSTSSTISIAQLLSLVNSEYKKYLPNNDVIDLEPININ